MKKKILVLSIFILLIVTISIFYSSTLKINLIKQIKGCDIVLMQ